MSDFLARTLAQPSNYQRKFKISVHALERFQERVEDEFKDWLAHDLGNLLDDRLKQSQVQYTVRDPRAPTMVTKLYEFAMRGDVFYGVVRENTIVTVLDRTMALNNFREQWSSVLNTPFTQESLKNVKPASPKPSLEVLGVAYAKAMRVRREAEAAFQQAEAGVTAARNILADAETKLETAKTALDAASEAAATAQRAIEQQA